MSDVLNIIKAKMGPSWDTWIKNRSQETPAEFDPTEERQGYENKWMKSKDALALINAITPYDLYTKPDSTPVPIDYPTEAMNIQNRGANSILGVPEANISMVDSSPLGMLNKMSNENVDYMPKRKYAQSVYEHELAHKNDMRSNPEKMWSFPNHGFTTYGGLSGGVLQREFPAMLAEDEYINGVLGKKK